MNQPQPRRAIRTVGAALVRTRRASRTVGPALPQTPLTHRTVCDTLEREWGKVGFNPDAIYYTSVSQGSKCDVFINISSRTRRVFLGLTPQNSHLGRRNTEKTT